MRPSKLRVLCLHGWRSNVAMMRLQTEALSVGLNDLVDLHFLQGPIEVQEAADSNVAALAQPPYYEWWGKDCSEADEQSAVDYVTTYMGSMGFDVVMGFSQGAAVVTLVAANLERCDSRCVRRVRLALLVCGIMPVSGPSVKIHTPSVHVIGVRDPFKHLSTQLAWDWFGGEEASENNTVDPGATIVLHHAGGHCFPVDSRKLIQVTRNHLLKHVATEVHGGGEIGLCVQRCTNRSCSVQ